MSDVDRASADEPGESESGADDTVLTIQQASLMLNVPAPTLRSWERRYGVPVADRSRGGHRRYARAQLDELRQMRDLIASGRRTAEAAALIRAGHPTSAGALVEAFVEAVRELASGRIAETLDTAHETLGIDQTVDEVLLPAMRRVGEAWHAGRIDISHEHIATNASQAWLATVRPPGPLRPHRPIILSCGPLDHHTLGLEAIGALLRHRRWDCRMLGARTPAESLAHAVVETDAAALVLVCHLAAGRSAAIEALHSPPLRHRHVFYAGGAFQSRRARHNVPGHYLGTNLAQATDLITAMLMSS